ncbi:MAG: RNA polymerase sigma factor [Oscillospiraceae bacterium]|nr:RNA polymerase sigma factor [Oscillospiraceae bacterium]
MTDQNVEKYVRLYHTMLHRVAFSYLRSRADAEDVCQDTFVRLMNFSGDFPTDEDCKRWLIRVAVNLSKNLLKYRRTHGEPLEYPDDNADIPAEPTAESELLPLIKSLPPEYGAVIHLFYYEGYSAKEIAQMLDISVTAVTSRLSRGRRRLKKLLTEEE